MPANVGSPECPFNRILALGSLLPLDTSPDLILLLTVTWLSNWMLLLLANELIEPSLSLPT